MAKNPKTLITDEEILGMNEVPVRTAADYLGMTYSMLAWQLQQGKMPFGTARKNKTWTYHINPQALVNYKNGIDDNGILLIIDKKLDEIFCLLKEYKELQGVS